MIKIKEKPALAVTGTGFQIGKGVATLSDHDPTQTLLDLQARMLRRRFRLTDMHAVLVASLAFEARP